MSQFAGSSVATFRKQTILDSVGKVLAKEYAGNKLVYFDMNSGDGMNVVKGKPLASSSLIVGDIFKVQDPAFEGHAFETNPDAITWLHFFLWGAGLSFNYTLHNSSNAEAIHEVIPNTSKGLAYYDPNGMIDLEVFSQFSKVNPHIDALLNVNRLINCRQRNDNFLSELIIRGKQTKKNCYISEREHNWFFLFFTNNDLSFSEYLYPLESENGQQAYENNEWTPYKHQVLIPA